LPFLAIGKKSQKKKRMYSTISLLKDFNVKLFANSQLANIDIDFVEEVYKLPLNLLLRQR
ncbi:MAG: hypothetical protein ACRC80_27925, partial [Waterburya sp.]